MSIIRCDGCGRDIDTDFDVECEVEPNTFACKVCREEKSRSDYEDEKADRCIAQMEAQTRKETL